MIYFVSWWPNCFKITSNMTKIVFIIFNILISIAGSTYSDDTKTSLPSNEYFSDHNIEVVSALSGSRIQLARRRDTLLYQGFDHYIEDAKSQKKDISSTIISRWEYAFPDDLGRLGVKGLNIEYT
jgi:hypothetical protein